MFQSILLPMIFGFTVFMCGMKLMELALHRLAGPHLTNVLQRSTATPIHGLAIGTATTAFLQSSTAVTLISIGLVNARLLTFPRTLGIILGTNIGTCITTELIGLNIHQIAPSLLTASIIVWLVTTLLGEVKIIPRLAELRWLDTVRSISVAVCGFGLLLSGLSIMQSIGPSVQESGMFAWFLEKAATNLWWGLAAGAILTAAIHSSAAVIGLVMGFVMIGAMPIELGVALVLGANIGTCVTALLASIGGSKAGRYVAYSHILLNTGGALLFLPFIEQLTAMSALISQTPASQIAHAQTIFNIASSLLALPFCYLKSIRKLEPV
ncbi:Na/Pi cotransporter family protein [Paenibacillus sp. GSMTC-2017]|uniref:Na/Pi cotransporter family protein n=1 Tax=Paenibacillus sp. GSMTC-2017 TaxID=2794350 RepID=UPI0018D996E4|nr:Na/Pi symporter [Paenibacillus sp. GSMTC-2017]MBH5318144.1 Na/Pi cotransporter family protein [Paenibacillus sp. GSMTC-2017]